MVKVVKMVKIASLVLFLIALVLTYSEISQQAATVVINRDIDGNVLFSIGKEYYFLYSAGFVVILNLFVSLTVMLLYRLPLSVLKIPNREFWFADDASRKNLYETIESWLHTLAILMQIFLMTVIVKVWSVNRDVHQTGNYGIFMYAGFALLIGWIIFIFIRLRIRRFDMV